MPADAAPLRIHAGFEAAVFKAAGAQSARLTVRADPEMSSPMPAIVLQPANANREPTINNAATKRPDMGNLVCETTMNWKKRILDGDSPLRILQ
ncbi:MAG: hypothetical protein ACRYHA_04305 [Janthinobacterium lividum]